MLPSSRELILSSAISRVAFHEKSNRIRVCTYRQEVYTIDLSTLEVIKRIPLPKQEESEFDYYYRPMAIKEDLLYVKLNETSKEYILNLNQKLDKVSIFDYNKQNHITKVNFSEDGQYLITGSSEGKTNLIEVISGTLIYELPFSADAISAVAFSVDGKFAVTSSFDKSFNILSVESLHLYPSIDINSVVEMIKFISDDVCLAITRDAKVLKIDASTQEILQVVELAEDIWPSEICISHSKKFAYIGTRESKLFALHINTLEIVFNVDLESSGVTSLVRTPQYLIVGFKTGELKFLNHREFEEKLILQVKLKKLKNIPSLFEKNIFLMTHRETRKIFDMWTEAKESIIKLSSNGEIEKAQQIASDYMFHPKCKKEMQEIEDLQPKLIALQRYIRSAAYSAAYELVEQEESLKSTLLYESLENIWKKSLQKAQILLSREPVLNIEKARNELKEFELVEVKKDMIEKMLSNANVFSRAEHAIRNKNFNLFFKLSIDFDFIQLTPLYKKVIQLAEKIKLDILNLMREEKYTQALESANLLKNFLPFANSANTFDKLINALMLIEYHIENKNLFEAVVVQQKMMIQIVYPPIIKLNKLKILYVKKLITKIDHYEFSSVYESIRKFFPVTIFYKETTLIMKKLYIAQINKALLEHRSEIDWEKTLKSYIEYFQYDNLIEEVYEKLTLTLPLEELSKKTEDNILQYKPSILTYKSQEEYRKL